MKIKFLPLIFLLMMYSFSGVLLQVLFLQTLFALDSEAQKVISVHDAVIKMQVNGISIVEAFSVIESQTEYSFAFDKKDIDPQIKVTLKANKESVANVLTEISKLSDLRFKQVNNNIHVSKMNNKRQPVIIVENSQARTVTGKVVSQEDSEPLPGVNVIEKGTSNGTVTSLEGSFTLNVSDGATLVFSSVGFITAEEIVGTRTTINISLVTDITALDEIVVVGYGVQKRSDITGTVASLGQDRLEMVPNLNIAQAIQGAIPGVMIQTTSAGAQPSQAIMVRGRNSIKASNDPLIVVDGVPYGGNISDINPNDVQSIEVLKDASSAAIYGSRGANGVILVTTKTGNKGKPKLSYDGYYSTQSYVNIPDFMDGREFYTFKQNRFPGQITLTEQEIYDSEEWVDWLELGLRDGYSHQHNLSVSGGFNESSYYVAAGIQDVKGLILNDDYLRVTTRANVDTKIAGWITLGTRTNLTYEDLGGIPPSISGLYSYNPLSRPFDEFGNLTLIPWPEDNSPNPLQQTLFDNTSNSYQLLTNNFAILDFPFMKGLSYRINTGARIRFRDDVTYRARNTLSGFNSGGSSDTQRRLYNAYVIENILSYNKQIDKHNIFATGVYSFERDKFTVHSTSASKFPHDFLTYYSVAQAEFLSSAYDYNNTGLVSQMLRMNYSYDSRYLFTITGRRDGYSGFGYAKKFGLFPSVAVGWNIVNENFFKYDLFSELKLRASIGLNGNQAVAAYESISRLGSDDYVDRGITLAGYRPTKLGQPDLGWEASKTINLGLDFGILNNRIVGDINVYKTNTTDLLLERTISAVHGITSISSNIGKTENTGFEFSINSRNIVTNDFSWRTNVNLAYVKNKIVSLYGLLDDEGVEINDVLNSWFIGQPVRVNYDYKWLGTWQIDESEEATKWDSQPGFVKLEDLDGNYTLDASDKQIIGQRDPKTLWGMTNSFSYKGIQLDVFMHGVHGITRNLPVSLMSDLETASVIRSSTTNKNWWTPENPTNEWVMNHLRAEYMSGIRGYVYENASFIRIKDVSLSYDIANLLKGKEKFGIDRLRVYITGRNLHTITKWRGLDPELDSQVQSPLQKEYVFGLNFSLM